MMSPRCTILLVEDEATVRRLVRLILEQQGYQVLEADRGEEALRLCRSYEGPIHLLLTDVRMPGMNGLYLAQQVVLLRPSTRVLYMSAYVDSAPLTHLLLTSQATFVQKPFSADVLVEKVREALAEPT
ncbi:response regulator [Nitrospira sp. Kam-Ns4a]